MQHTDRISPVLTVGVLILSLLALIAIPAAGSAQEKAAAPEVEAATPEAEAPEAPPSMAEEAERAADAETGVAGTEAAEGQPAGEEAKEQVDPEKWQRRYRKYNSWQGATGGILLVDPSSAAPGSVRLQLVIEDFSDTDFLYKGDRVDQVGETLSVGWTATEIMEVFGSIRHLGTTSRRPDPENSDRRIKESYNIMGDLRLGLKMGDEVDPLLGLGGDLSVLLPNETGGVGPLLNSMSVQLRFSLATDLRNLESKVPLIFRLNLGWLFDNSALLVEGVENARYDNLEDPRSRKIERRQYITRLERFSLDINRVDQIFWAMGVEAPLQVAEGWYLHPMVEWRWGFPSNRRGFLCPSYSDWNSPTDWDNHRVQDDRCQGDYGVKVYPMVLAAGIRGISPIRGLSAMLGVDIGLTGTSKFVRELAPNAPYRVLIAAGYDYDARPPKVRVVEREVPAKEVAAAPEGRVKGMVIQQGTNAPLPRATVSFIGRDLSPIQTNDNGAFVSYPFAPGMVEMEVSHPDFQRGGCSAVIGEKGGDVETKCYMFPLPTAGQANGVVVDQFGTAVAGARIDLTGPESSSLTADQSGQFQKQLAAGDYQARVDADGYLIRLSNFTIAPRQTASVRFVLAQKLAKGTVELKGNEIRFKEPLKFPPKSTELGPESAPVIAELADLLLRSPQIHRIKIWGSTAGGEEASVSLVRALSVKRRLVEAGIEADRIDAVAGDSARVKVTVEQ